jgi:hypothetical protein
MTVRYTPVLVRDLKTFRIAARMKSGESAVFEVDAGKGDWKKAMALAKTYPGVKNVIVRIK